MKFSQRAMPSFTLQVTHFMSVSGSSVCSNQTTVAAGNIKRITYRLSYRSFSLGKSYVTLKKKRTEVVVSTWEVAI